MIIIFGWFFLLFSYGWVLRKHINQIFQQSSRNLRSSFNINFNGTMYFPSYVQIITLTLAISSVLYMLQKYWKRNYVMYVRMRGLNNLFWGRHTPYTCIWRPKFSFRKGYSDVVKLEIAYGYLKFCHFA